MPMLRVPCLFSGKMTNQNRLTFIKFLKFSYNVYNCAFGEGLNKRPSKT